MTEQQIVQQLLDACQGALSRFDRECPRQSPEVRKAVVAAYLSGAMQAASFLTRSDVSSQILERALAEVGARLNLYKT